jgi:hypothetical protein
MPNAILRMSWKTSRSGSGDRDRKSLQLCLQVHLVSPDGGRRLCRSSIRGHSEIMFGVLVVVLGGNPIARLEFSLGQSHVPVIASSRVVGALWLWGRHTRWQPLRADSYPSQSRLTRIHVCLSAIRMAHSVRLAGERWCCARMIRAVQYRPEDWPTHPAGRIYDADAVLAGG